MYTVVVGWTENVLQSPRSIKIQTHYVPLKAKIMSMIEMDLPSSIIKSNHSVRNVLLQKGTMYANASYAQK